MSGRDTRKPITTLIKWFSLLEVMMFDSDDENDFCAGVSKPARIFNPDKLLEESVMQELRGYVYKKISAKDFRNLKRKEHENL
ncbi:MAG: hypothetical protein AABY22_26520 [Nanoarchaeota archaeon]